MNTFLRQLQIIYTIFNEFKKMPTIAFFTLLFDKNVLTFSFYNINTL